MTKDERRQRRRVAWEYIHQYIETYPTQDGWEDYTDEIYIDDLLYGLGVSIDEDKYSYAEGFRKFKDRLRAHLGVPGEGGTMYVESKPT